jgi:hypothetical protein
MTEYFDIRCGDDLDLFARDARPLEVLAQDIYHWLTTGRNTLFLDLDWGFGLDNYIGKPLPHPDTLAFDVENALRRWDRVESAKCVIAPIDGAVDAYRFDLQVQCDEGFLEIALAMTPSGIVRVA